MRVDCGGAVSKLVHIVLAHQHGPRLAQLSGHRGIFRRHVIGQDLRAAGGANSRGQIKVFERDGNSVERSAILASGNLGLGRACLRSGQVGGDGDERPERRIQSLDPSKHGIGQLDRRHLALLDERRQLGDRRERQVVARHCVTSAIGRQPLQSADELRRPLEQPRNLFLGDASQPQSVARGRCGIDVKHGVLLSIGEPTTSLPGDHGSAPIDYNC